MVKSVSAVLAIALVLVWTGCGGSKEAAPSTVEERFNQAKKMFEDGDYQEALAQFRIITLQFQGSGFAGDAQFYLGECHFARAEYLLAAFEYSTLKKNYASNSHVPDAQYKIGLCYYHLSPKSVLDQQYSRKAIDELQTFLDYYPTNPHVPDAEAKIKELNDRLAKKTYETAQQYEKLDYTKAALFYYKSVIDNFHDTDYAPLAYLARVQLLMNRKRYQEAKDEVEAFLARYPNSVLRSKAEALRKNIDAALQSAAPQPANADTNHASTSIGSSAETSLP